MNVRQLIKWANTRFPKRDYLPESAVRHNRRELVRAICNLRSNPNGSKWVVDQQVTRKCAS